MSNIHFRRFSSASPHGWEFDCYVSPDDKTNGELIQYSSKQLVDYNGKLEAGLFAALDRLLDRMPSGEDIPKGKVRLVLGRSHNGKKTYHFLETLDKYPPTSPPTEIWRLVNAIFEERMREIGQRANPDISQKR